MFYAELFIIVIIIFLGNLAVLTSGELILVYGYGRGWPKQMEEKISGEGPACWIILECFGIMTSFRVEGKPEIWC